MFVVVTLLVALGIAAAQGCQGPARSLGDDRGVRGDVQREQSYEPLQGDLMEQRYWSELHQQKY